MLSYAPLFFKYCILTILFISSSSVFANIAQEFGTATQGSNYGSSVAPFAIDGDETTYNHTGCNVTDNWWQVSLPDPSVISRIVVNNFMTSDSDAMIAKSSSDSNFAFMASEHCPNTTENIDALFCQ